jgi:hypothetical protein
MDTSVDTLADIDFTPNSDRAIWVEGEMNQALLAFRTAGRPWNGPRTDS